MRKLFSIILAIIFVASLGTVYAADGDIIWEKIGPNGYVYDIAVDSKDNIIIVQDVGTRKYDPNGNLLTEIGFGYNGVAVDSKDNIIIAGSSTRKYDPNGNLLKEISFPGNDVAVDSKDNIIIAGSSTRKYDPNGNLLTEISFGGDIVAVDSKDNILVDDGYFTTRKYSSTGTFIWEKEFNSGGSYDYSYGVATDSFDNVIVSGYNGNSVSTWASLIVKYSPNGTKLWDIIDDVEPRWSYGVAVDSYNNIIVAGGRYTSYDWLTKKYDSNGNKIWERAFDFGGGDDEGWAVAVDSKNDIIVTGWVYSGFRNSYTVKYGGVPPMSKSLPIAQILKILRLNKEK